MKSLIRRWARDEGATTAVEFSFVAMPFILLTVGIVEMALMFTAQSLLQESAFSASRLIRTGQLQATAPGGQEEMFRDAVCDFAELLIPCADIQFQVQTAPSFGDAADMPPQWDASGNLINPGFDPGVESSIVLVRVVYNYPIKTPLMQPILSNRGGSNRTMISTIVLQTEPYE